MQSDVFTPIVFGYLQAKVGLYYFVYYVAVVVQDRICR